MDTLKQQPSLISRQRLLRKRKAVDCPLPATESLRSRIIHRKKHAAHVDHALAVAVYHRLIVPMFAVANKRPASREPAGFPSDVARSSTAMLRTQSSTRLRQSSRQSSTQTLMELGIRQQQKTLSQLMREEIEATRKAKVRTEAELRQATTEKLVVDEELSQLKADVLNAQALLKSLKETRKCCSIKTPSTDAATLQTKLRHIEVSTKDLKEGYAREKLANTEFNLANIQAQHQHALLGLTHMLMCEHMIQLHKVVPAYDLRVAALRQALQQSTQTLEAEQVEATFYDFSAEFDSFMDRGRLVFVEYLDLCETLKRLKRSVREQLTAQKTSHSTITLELSQLQQALPDLEHRYDCMLVMYQADQHKLSKLLRLKRLSQSSQDLLELCKQCGEQFTARDNSETACVYHISTFSAGIYWCCGSTKKDSQGCRKTSHVPMFEEAESAEPAPLVCSSCKRDTHSPLKCPFDPNRSLAPVPRRIRMGAVNARLNAESKSES